MYGHFSFVIIIYSNNPLLLFSFKFDYSILVTSDAQMIRGVKVRQAGTKSETKRPGKSQRNQHASTPSGNNGSSSKKQ